MKKLFLLAMAVLGGLFSSHAQTSPYTGSVLAEGDFFLYNVESGLWLQNNEKNTSDWNTRGATGTYGFEFGISAIDGGWKLDPKFGNNHSMNASNFYLDTGDDVTAWTLEPKTVEGVSNAYTIKSGDQVLGLDDNENLALGNENKSTWQLVTRDERVKYLKINASAEAPIDATFFIMDPSFANANERASAWTWERDGGNLDDVRWFWNRRSYAVWNSSSFKLSQLISNIPNGTYKLTVKGYYRDGNAVDVRDRRTAGTENIIGKYFINDDKEPFKSILDGAQPSVIDGIFWEGDETYGYYPDDANGFNRAFQDYPDAYQNTGVTSVVTTKSMTIGIEKLEANANDWLAFDDFRLVYLGSDIDINEYLANLRNAIDGAKAVNTANTSDVLAATLAAAIADGEAALNSIDEDEIADATAAIATAKNAVETVNVSVLKATAALAEAEGIDVAAANDVAANATTAAQVDLVLYDLRTARKINALHLPDIYTGSAPVANEEVYLYNIGTGLFFSNGSDWNTHAAVDQYGLPIVLIDNGDGKFKFQTHMFSGREEKWVNWNAYVDTGDQHTWQFNAVEGKTNVYTINSEGDRTDVGRLLGYDPYGPTDKGGYLYWSTVAMDRENVNNPNNQWKIVTQAELATLIANATEENPVNVSYLIDNGGLSRVWGLDMWAKQCEGGNNGAHVTVSDDGYFDRNSDYGYEVWNANNFSFTQEISDLRPGQYLVSVNGFFRQGDGGFQAGIVNNGGELISEAYLVANDAQEYLPNIASEAGNLPGIASRSSDNGAFADWPAEALQAFQSGLYYTSVIATVDEDGKLTIGVKQDQKTTDASWVLFDNFRLTYLGNKQSIDVAVTDAGYATFVAPFEAAVPDNVTANIAEVSEDGVTLDLTPVAGDVIPANTPVVLEAAAGDYTFTGYAVEAVDAPAAGALIGTYEDIDAPAGSYVLQNQEAGVGFYLVEDVQPTVKANRAYLVVPAQAVKAYLLNGDTATAIQSVKGNQNGAAIYNLAGQRVSKAQKGIFIVGGNKMVK